ncbi:hypothetical protein HDU91_002092, partial [Kappamyces sp. JEL0680]
HSHGQESHNSQSPVKNQTGGVTSSTSIDSKAAREKHSHMVDKQKNAEKSRAAKVFMLKIGVYGVIGMYASVIFLMICHVIVAEAFANDLVSQYRGKIGLDLFFWVYRSWFLIFFFSKI